MARRRYWVVSPNVTNNLKTLEGWKEEILKRHVAIMGYGPSEYKGKQGRNKTGPQFAGRGNPSVQQGDVVLIARSRTLKEVIAAGVVDSEYWLQRFPQLYRKRVQLRHLEPFKLFREVPKTLPLERVLPWKPAMRELRPENSDDKKVTDWLEQQLKADNRTYGGGSRSHSIPRQPDTQLRHAVEDAAMKVVRKFYEEQHYYVDDVSANRCGWDLEATKDQCTLKIEVKGLSGTTAVTELTPNEYQHIKEEDSSYRLCIVTNALHRTPTIQEFYFDPQEEAWVGQNGNQLNIEPRESARVKG